ncbi:18S rRNA (guanine-N(7))-methyltransferase [Sinocyclocheilus rhinocerous]|uniref:18S rRNA (guanine-N(7))-methyltransferase n=1 Tax=Sinocyclocheilus rhinocerous TaxID=307959 RepID=UPI0007B9EF67|nr:PREDICTED: probable 18S rRNA (guanine-N(7))-methyltransferase [Sinocyclocheilus rhinocerous]
MSSSCRRPEHMAPPEVFYNEQEAKKYSQNSRMIEIQTQMSERAVELLSLPEDQPCYLLDVGCGSGLSGDYLSEAGHYWVGVDISTAMLGEVWFLSEVLWFLCQLELITAQAMKAGFTGGMVVDFSNSSKAKKFFLCLFAGVSGVLPKGLGSESTDRGVSNQAQFTAQRSRFRNMKGKSVKKSKDWIMEKKERRRRQGKDVRADTKYTARHRKPRF